MNRGNSRDDDDQVEAQRNPSKQSDRKPKPESDDGTQGQRTEAPGAGFPDPD